MRKFITMLLVLTSSSLVLGKTESLCFHGGPLSASCTPVYPLDSLSQTVEALRSAFKRRDYGGFLALFSKDFTSFKLLYGYSDTTGPAPLYSQYEAHINYYFNCHRNEEGILAHRLVAFSANAHWEADAVGLLQRSLVDFTFKYPLLIATELQRRDRFEGEAFWFFFFDGSNKGDLQSLEEFNSVFRIMRQVAPEQVSIIEDVYYRTYR